MSHIGLMAVNPLIYPDSGYDLNKDFVPVTQLSRVPSLFVVHKDVPATDMKSLIACVKSRPGQLNYACAGNACAAAPHQERRIALHCRGHDRTHPGFA